MEDRFRVELPDKSQFEVNEAEWRQLWSATWTSLRDPGYLTWTPALRRHDDGRHLISVAFEQPGGAVTVVGELVNTGDSLAEALYRSVARSGLEGLPEAWVDAMTHASRG